MGKEDGVATAPTETCSADLQVVGRKWRRRCAESFEEVEDARFADGCAVFEEPWDYHPHSFGDVERLVEEGREPGGWLFNFIFH